MSDPIPTDFWGIVVPTWLGGVGSVGASIAAVVAIVTSRSARRGVENIGSGLNAQSEIRDDWAEFVQDFATPASAESDETAESEEAPQKPEPIEASLFNPRVRWRLLYVSKNRYALMNDSILSAHVKSVKNVSDGHRDALTVLTEPPITIDAGSQILLSVDKSFASPAVTAVEVQWTEGHDGRQHSAVFYI